MPRLLVAMVLGALIAGSGGCRPREAAISPTTPTASLVDTEWTLVELDGAPAGKGAGGRAPTLLLTAEGRLASGFAGCNRMSGTFELEGERLRIISLATTRMACAEGMELEQRYLEALDEVREYRLTATGLDLLDDGAVRARFEVR
jgi:heat shock protein HslJ